MLRPQIPMTSARATRRTEWSPATSLIPLELLTCVAVASDAHGIVDFAALQRTASKRQEDGLALWAFDLLYASARDIRSMSYVERKERLASLVDRAGIPALLHSEAFDDGQSSSRLISPKR
jgi:ATP-dependent DNA ligase